MGGRGAINHAPTYVEIVRAEGLPVEEQVPVGLDAMQGQVDRDQDELALDVLVRHGAAVALRVHSCVNFEGQHRKGSTAKNSRYLRGLGSAGESSSISRLILYY